MSTTGTVFIVAICGLFLSACSIQRVPVRQRVTVAGRFTIGDNVVTRYRAYNPAALDSGEQILRYEYLPLECYIVTNPGDSLKYFIVAAWQEYLSRFANRLSPVDKQYYTPTYGGLKTNADSVYIIWNFPSVEGRDRELKYSDKIRNEYWSIDLFEPEGAGHQLYESSMRSYPQINVYHFRDRFSAGGSYQRAMADSAWISVRLRSELDKAVPGGKPPK